MVIINKIAIFIVVLYDYDEVFMKVKDLRAALKGLPANMEVVVNTGLYDREDNPDVYREIVLSPRKAKKKLIKEVEGYTLVQSRPKKDDQARIAVVIE